MLKHITYAIYLITCLPTSQRYVGLSKNAKRRRSQHFSQLRNNSHVNQLLQDAFNQFGEQAFAFMVLEYDVQLSEVSKREVFWIQHFAAQGEMFNLTHGGELGDFLNFTQPVLGIYYPCPVDFPVALGPELRKHLTDVHAIENDMGEWGKPSLSVDNPMSPSNRVRRSRLTAKYRQLFKK